jgi:hypothetical protein
MAKLTISDAARACRVARRTRQRAINAGRLSLDPEHLVDTAELIRAGYTLPAARQADGRRVLHGSLQDAAPRSARPRQAAADLQAPAAALLQQTIAALERENALLRAALDAAAAREQDARANAPTAREERTLLLQRLQDRQQRYDRLLDMPRSAPALPRPLQGPLGDPRGAVRRRIIALLRDHPEGLMPTEIKDWLGVARSLADTCLGMRRDGLLQRVGRGRYVAGALSQPDQP